MQSASSARAKAAPASTGHRYGWQLAQLTAPKRCFAFDSFGVLPLRLESIDLALIQFYFLQSSETPGHWRTEPRHLQVMRMPKALMKSHTESSLTDEITLASLMVYLASTYDRQKQTTWSQTSLKWMSKALSATQRTLLKDPTVTSSVLLAMSNLAVAEAQRSNAAALRVHLEAVKKVIVAGRGQTTTNFVMFNQLSACDTRLACEELSPPILPITSSTRLASAEVKTNNHEAITALQARGTGFSTLMPYLPHTMLTIIEEMVECFKVLQRYIEEPETEVEVVEWIQTQRVMSRYKLLSLELSTPQLQAIRITLLIWSFTYQINTFSDPTVSALVAHLEVFLASRQQWLWSVSDQDLIAWMLISGAIADKSSEGENWFIREVVKTFPNRTDEKACWEESRAIMERFLFLDGVRDAGLRKLARRVSL